MAPHLIVLLNITQGNIGGPNGPPPLAQLCNRPTKQRTGTQIYCLSRFLLSFDRQGGLPILEFGNTKETVTDQVLC